MPRRWSDLTPGYRRRLQRQGITGRRYAAWQRTSPKTRRRLAELGVDRETYLTIGRTADLRFRIELLDYPGRFIPDSWLARVTGRPDRYTVILNARWAATDGTTMWRSYSFPSSQRLEVAYMIARIRELGERDYGMADLESVRFGRGFLSA